MTATGDGFEYVCRVKIGSMDYSRYVFADSIDGAEAEILAAWEKEPRDYERKVLRVEFTGRRRIDGFLRN